MKPLKASVLTLTITLGLLDILSGRSAQAQKSTGLIGERPALEEHVNQSDKRLRNILELFNR